MSTAKNLGFDYLTEGQASAEVTANEALGVLDAMVYAVVLNSSLTTPPVSPSDGDVYIVAALATGAWASKDTQIAIYQNAGWRFAVPAAGCLMYDNTAAEYLRYSGTAWSEYQPGGLHNVVEDVTPQLGGDLDANSHKIINLTDPTANQDAASKKYVDDNTLASLNEDATPKLAANLDANTKKITNLADGVNAQDAVTKAQLDALSGLSGSPITLGGTWIGGGAFPSGAVQGETYIVTGATTVDGVSFNVNDRILALIGSPSTSTYAGNWFKLDYTDNVLSVFGRVGAIVAASGDYNADQVDETATRKWAAETGAQVNVIQAVVDDTAPKLGADLDAQTKKIINLGNPGAAQDAATKYYVDNNIGPANAAAMPYVPSTAASWSGNPTTVGEALDRIAAEVATLKGSAIT